MGVVALDAAGGPAGATAGLAFWGAVPAGALGGVAGEAGGWGDDGNDGNEGDDGDDGGDDGDGDEAVMGEDPQAVRKAATETATPVTASTTRGRRKREGNFMVMVCVEVGRACRKFAGCRKV